MLLPVYRGADLFVFPSLEETFGLPLLEAMGVGIPVVVSDWRLAPGGERERVNVGPEICGEVAEYFDPTSPTSLVGTMQRVLMDHSRRVELARMGQIRAREFSWDKAATALIATFEEAAAAPSRD
jgi:glycosyltransferase involved in cell wall biosynthesis